MTERQGRQDALAPVRPGSLNSGTVYPHAILDCSWVPEIQIISRGRILTSSRQLKALRSWVKCAQVGEVVQPRHVAGGHIHQAAAAERSEFLVAGDESAGPVVVATAPGLGRPRPGRSGEAQGTQIYVATAEALRVVTYVWHGSSFEPVAAREYPRATASKS